jgi:hypothetical protein
LPIVLATTLHLAFLTLRFLPYMLKDSLFLQR